MHTVTHVHMCMHAHTHTQTHTHISNSKLPISRGRDILGHSDRLTNTHAHSDTCAHVRARTDR